MMKRTRVVKCKNTILLSICIVCAGLVGSAQAVSPVQPYPVEPFVSISVSDGINLGAVSLGSHKLPATLRVHIAANFPHHVEAAFTGPFTHGSGQAVIGLDRTNVKMLTSISSPAGTPCGGEDVDINLEFGVVTTPADLAGTYTGTLTLTIMPGA